MLGELPSLLSLGALRAAPHVFTDLELDGVLSSRCREVLSRSCSKEEALRRQEMFRALSDPALSQAFASFLQECYSYEKWLGLSAAGNPLTVLYAGRALCRMIRGVVPFSHLEIFVSLTEFFETLQRKNPRLPDETEAVLSALAKSPSMVVSLGGRRTSIAVGGAVRNLCADLNLNEASPISGNLPSDLLDRFVAEGDRKRMLNAYVRRYSEAFPTGVADLIRDCEFFAEICRLREGSADRWNAWCYPELSKSTFSFCEGYHVLNSRPVTSPVGNDFEKTHSFTLIRGVNSGGKTTFLRLCGVVALLGGAGCPVPCLRARIPLYERIETVFAEGERLDEGRFDSEQDRLRRRCAGLGEAALLLVNELFSSTKASLAVSSVAELRREGAARGWDCLFVTHFDLPPAEDYFTLFAGVLSDGTPSYRIERTDAPVASFTWAILKKHGLGRYLPEWGKELT